ncbi:MAG: hypothetical protein COV44_01305 [Deltaproteobacteria bacterium CG11_big_fil_rev_8_21_14_0_20_45_16]|nr:MAG: hypothetical protein COV44_01305 [Deltaproteobacteria bacterium CG11_big_fil_rev_8_21_14_0_20_45_16]
MLLLALYLSLLREVDPSIEEILVTAQIFAKETYGLRFVLASDSASSTAYFDGNVYRMEDYAMLQEIISRSQNRIESRADLAPNFLKDLQLELERILNTSVQISANRLEVNIVPNLSDKQFQQVLRIHPYLKINRNSTRRHSESPKMDSVFLELAFVEIQKSSLEKLGLRFGEPLSFASSVFPQNILNPSKLLAVDGINPIGSFLDLAVAKGFAQVHLKHSLVTSNAEAASFRAGGEFSFQLSSEQSAKIEKIPYGVDLEFVPTELGGNQVRIEIKAKIREPDLATGVGDYPGITEKIIQTQVRTGFGQSMAVAGLLHSSQGSAQNSLPGLGEIPLLGRIFSSKSFRANKSEAYIFITARRLENER